MQAVSVSSNAADRNALVFEAMVEAVEMAAAGGSAACSDALSSIH